MEIIGWIGSICFSLCALPQAVASFKQGHSDGISKIFLALWLTGEICMLWYTWRFGNLPITLNYLANLACLLVIIRYKVRSTHKNIT